MRRAARRTAGKIYKNHYEMNIIPKNKSVKAMLMLAVFMMFGITSHAAGYPEAQSKLSIDNPVTFSSSEATMLTINFDKKEPIVGMSFNIALPDFLEFAGTNIQKNESRFNNHQVQMKTNGNVLVYSMQQYEITGDEGPLLYIPVKVKDNVTTPESGVITVRNIAFSGKPESTTTATGWTQEAFDVTAVYSPFSAIVSASNAKLNIIPGTPCSLGIDVEADTKILGFTMDLVMPAGLTLDPASWTCSNRCPGDGQVIVRERDFGYALMYIAPMSNTPLSGNSGQVFTINVISDASYDVASANIQVKNIVLSNINNIEVTADPFTIEAVNETPLHNTLTASVADLQTKLAAALETIETECPDVKDDFTGAEISAKIAEISEKIESYFTAGTLTANAAALQAEIAGVEADITALVADAKAAEAEYKENQRKAANQAAYDATLAQIATLQAALDAAKATCEEQYPGIDITANVTAAQNAIDAVKAAALAAFNAVATEGVYSYTFESAPIQALIDKVEAEAKAAYEAAQEEARVAANQAAYNAVLAEIAALQEQYDEVVAQVAEDYPEVDVTAEKTAAQNAINAAKAAALAAFEAVAEAGTFEYTVPTADIQAKIQAIVEAAVAGSEESRQAYNLQAYNAAIAAITDLQEQLDEAISYAETNCPHANVLAEVNAAQTAINNARTAAEAAKLACAEEGLFDYTVPTEDIYALIAAVTQAADDKEAAWKEEQRKAANLAAYNASLAEIQALQASLDAMKSKVETEFPDYDAAADIAAAQAAIDNAKNAADAAYAAVADEGEYDYDVPSDDINALIQAIYDNAKESGIHGINVDNLAPGTKLFNLQGQVVTRPTPGTIVIVVTPNGKPSKHVIR